VVRVVDVPGVSMELCGGTHVANTAEIGLFKIVAESGVAAGIRRIEAVAGPAVLAYLNERDAVVRALGDRFKAQPSEIVERVAALQEELKGSQKALAAARGELAVAKAAALVDKVKPLEGTQFSTLVERVDGIEVPDLQKVAKNLQEKLGPGALVMVTGAPSPGKVGFGTAFGPKAVESGANARDLTSLVAKICGGGGGGSDSIAQAGGKDESALPEALSKAKRKMKVMIVTRRYGDGNKQIRQSTRVSGKPAERDRFESALIRFTVSKRNRTPKVAD